MLGEIMELAPDRTVPEVRQYPVPTCDEPAFEDHEYPDWTAATSRVVRYYFPRWSLGTAKADAKRKYGRVFEACSDGHVILCRVPRCGQ